jgi:hypothetical protein
MRNRVTAWALILPSQIHWDVIVILKVGQEDSLLVNIVYYIQNVCWWGCNYLKNTRRNSTFRAKVLGIRRDTNFLREGLTNNFSTKGLRSKRRNSPCIFQVVVFVSIEVLLLLAPPTLARPDRPLHYIHRARKHMHAWVSSFYALEELTSTTNADEDRNIKVWHIIIMHNLSMFVHNYNK